MKPGPRAKQAARSDTVQRLGRFGLAARGAVYLLVGIVALLIAFGHRSGEPDQRGALQELATHSYGLVLIWIIFLGLVAYAVWAFSQAAVGVAGEGDKAFPRVKQAISGCVYAALAASAFSIAIGSHTKSQAHQQQAWTARAMSHPAGRWGVALLGIILIGVGVAMAYEGLAKKFEKDLATAQMDQSTRRAVEALGTVGSVARGLVIGIAGVLLVDAAWTFDAKKSRGLDGALRTLQQTTFGPWLLGLVALGLIAFGAYGFAEAKYRRT